MKKLFLCLFALTVLAACKNDSKTETTEETTPKATNDKSTKQNDGLITMRGDFIYYSDAAVLQTPREIYGVIINDKMHELNKQAATHKKENTDMVTVTVRCKKSKKAEGAEGWDNLVEIIEVLKVEPLGAGKDEVIKLGS